MKHKFNLLLMLVLTALIFTLANPAWHVLDTIKSHNALGTHTSDILLIWAETCIGIAAFAIIITLIIPPFSRFFLGYESKKADEGDDIFYYVVMTLFVFGLCLVAQQWLLDPQRDSEKDVKYLCQTLNNYDLDLNDTAQDKIDAICSDNNEQNDTQEKNDAGKIQIRLPMRKE